MKDYIENFFHIYLENRDCEETVSFFTENVIYIGTGKHEIALGKDNVRELIKQEM